jgi:hypothetical protein
MMITSNRVLKLSKSVRGTPIKTPPKAIRVKQRLMRLPRT